MVGIVQIIKPFQRLDVVQFVKRHQDVRNNAAQDRPDDIIGPGESEIFKHEGQKDRQEAGIQAAVKRQRLKVVMAAESSQFNAEELFAQFFISVGDDVQGKMQNKTQNKCQGAGLDSFADDHGGGGMDGDEHRKLKWW